VSGGSEGEPNGFLHTEHFWDGGSSSTMVAFRESGTLLDLVRTGIGRELILGPDGPTLLGVGRTGV